MKLRIVKKSTDSLWFLQEKAFLGWKTLAWRVHREELEEIAKKYTKGKYEYYREWTCT